jgi:uncharacterized membrane protein
MRLDLPYFIAELLVLWVPLSCLLWLTQQLGINWIYTDIIMLVAYILIVFLCQVNAFLSAIFHVKKREGNVWLETLLFWVVTIGSLFLALHIIDNIVMGIMVVMFLSILSSSIIIGP